MRAVVIGLVALGCGGAPASAPLVEHRAARAAPLATALPKQLVHRNLSVGSRAARPSRSTWTLTFDESGSTATLVSTEEEAAGPLSLERADRDAAWTALPAETHAQAGPVRHVGDHLVLELATPVDSLYLYCWPRTLQVAPAGARRVARPGHAHDCADGGMWSTTAAVSVAALVCGQEDAGDERDLETHWEFAAAPGIERVEDSTDCLASQGLRVAR